MVVRRVDGQVECNRTIAVYAIGHHVLIGATGSVKIVVPSHAVTHCEGFTSASAMVDRQVEGERAITADRIGQLVSRHAAGSIGLAIPIE